MKQMKQKRESLRKDKRGFTGLEAAIVLTAFVVVAAVFSYVVLNAGFFSTQKAKEVVHSGVEQATSSVELAGNVVGYGMSVYDGVRYSTYTSVTGVANESTISGLTSSNMPTYSNVTFTVTTGNSSDTTLNIDDGTQTNFEAGPTSITSGGTAYANATVAGTTYWMNITSSGNDSEFVNLTFTFDTCEMLDTPATGQATLNATRFYLQLTAGLEPMDMDGLTISFFSGDTHVSDLTHNTGAGGAEIGGNNLGLATSGEWNHKMIKPTGFGDLDSVLELGEKAQITVSIPGGGLDTDADFVIEVKPAKGSTIAIERTVPSGIDPVMDLL